MDGPAVVAFIITPFVLPIGFIIGHAATQVYGYSLTNMFVRPIVMLGSGYIGKEMVMVTPAEIIIISYGSLFLLLSGIVRIRRRFRAT